MASQRKHASSRNGGMSDFIWNLVGGALVSGMLAGVVYLFIGMFGKYVNYTEKFWELAYLKWYFIVILAIYLLVPALLANIVGFIFGSKSRASGSKPRNL